MTSDPDQPSRGNEHPPPTNTPPHADPHAPLDYPDNPGLPPPVYPTQYPYPPAPPGYPPAAQGYPGAAGGWYPPTYPPTYDPYQPVKPPGTNGTAIASLVCSLAGLACCVLSIVGLILGIVAMRETKRTGQDGYGMALAATIIGAVIVVGYPVLYLLIVFAGSSTQYTP